MVFTLVKQEVSMLTPERRDYILEVLHQEGRVLAPGLSVQLGVSEGTIRRDLRDLAAEGLIKRVHGGALPVSPATAPWRAREQQAPEAKLAIAQAAIQLIRPGQAVILDGGTTNLLVAQNLPAELDVTVITHSPPIAAALMDHPRVEIVLLGGRIFKHSRVAIGAATVAAVRQIRADLYMLGVCSLHPDVGISNQDFEEAELKRAMIASAGEVVALASAEKLDTASRYVVSPLTALTHIITDRRIARAQLAPYEALGITIIRA
jgi:DeoR/GlpR family transcriptional regulator of sugar metabolism